MHGPRNVLVPSICPCLQLLPLVVSVLPPNLLIPLIYFLLARDRGSEIGDFGDYV